MIKNNISVNSLILSWLLFFSTTTFAQQHSICSKKAKPFKNEIDLIVTIKDHLLTTINAIKKADKKFPEAEYNDKLNEIVYVYAHVVEDMELWSSCFDSKGKIIHKTTFKERHFSTKTRFRNRLIRNHLIIANIYNQLKPYQGNYKEIYDVFDMDMATSQYIQLKELDSDQQ